MKAVAWCRRARPALVSAAVLMTACQSGPAGGPLRHQTDDGGPVATLQRINAAGARCWAGSADPAFRTLRLVPELDTTAGRPRLLVLEKEKIEGLPALVIEAQGDPATIETYGPLAATPTGARINRDIMRWSGGRLSCHG